MFDWQLIRLSLAPSFPFELTITLQNRPGCLTQKLFYGRAMEMK